MPNAPAGFVHQRELKESIDGAVRQLDPLEVAHVAYRIGSDSTDDPALFFRIILTDSASRLETLADVTQRISARLFNFIHPIEEWGLTPYFSFRSASEQQKLNDPEWN